jgi:serine/threonine-protein kinase
MATVYLARSRGARGFERNVALKLTHPHLSEASEFSSLLLDEANIAARIRHRNVVTVLDVGEDPHGLFLVMDYVEGDSLAGLLRQARKAGLTLPASIGIRILLDALAGLHAAHSLCDERGRELSVVHRDFTPQNILVALDGVAQLTDFGVARASDRLAHTATGVIKGKTGYMSPEQAKGHDVDRRTDVWAAGAVAWELLAGRRLYQEGAGGVATILKLVSEAPPLLGSVAPRVHRELEAVVASALTLDVNARCATAADFASELAAAFELREQLPRHDEVAAWVEKLAGPKLAERRAHAERAIQLRAKMDALAAASIESQQTSTPEIPSAELADPTEFDPPISVEPPTSMRVALEARGAPPRRRTVAMALAGAFVLAVVGGVAWFVTRPAAGSARPAASIETAVSSAAATAAPPSESTSAAASSAPRGDFVDIVASAPVSLVRIENRSVALASPTTEVTFSLSEDERRRPLRLEVFASDGRKVVTNLAPGATSLRVDFAGRPSAARPSAPPRAPSSDCNPPYTLDSDGVRHPKRQCF